MIYEDMQNRGLLKQNLQSLRTTAFCIGHHNDAWPVVSNALAFFLSNACERTAFNNFLSYEQAKKMHMELKRIADESIKLHSEGKQPSPVSATSISTSRALTSMLAALLYNDPNAVINAAVPYYYKGSLLYAELPVYFKNGSALVHEGLMENLTRDDTNEFNARLEELISYAEQFGIVKDNSALLPLPLKIQATNEAPLVKTKPNLRIIGKAKKGGLKLYNLPKAETRIIPIQGLADILEANNNIYASTACLELGMLNSKTVNKLYKINLSSANQPISPDILLCSFEHPANLTAVCLSGQNLYLSFYNSQKSEVMEMDLKEMQAGREIIHASEKMQVGKEIIDAADYKNCMQPKFTLEGRITSFNRLYSNKSYELFAAQTENALSFLVLDAEQQQSIEVPCVCSYIEEHEGSMLKVALLSKKDLQIQWYKNEAGNLMLVSAESFPISEYKRPYSLKIINNTVFLSHKIDENTYLDIFNLAKWSPEIRRHALDITGGAYIIEGEAPENGPELL
ncbi:hypothetical protein HZB88_02815 [archaeon]|nr:hypothetical protein [archaeon]